MKSNRPFVQDDLETEQKLVKLCVVDMHIITFLCVYLYKHNKYTQHTHIYYVHKMSQNAHRLILSYRQKKVTNVDFGRISGFHKNEFLKASSSNPNAPNSN